jgi:hypothetical protein
MALEGGETDTRADGVSNHERAMGVGETTDQLRTTTAELSAPQRSTMDTSDKWFRLDKRGHPMWGSRGREFKSRQPDRTIQSIRPSRPQPPIDLGWGLPVVSIFVGP